MPMQLYEYVWGSKGNILQEYRLQYKGRKCRIISKGAMNSVLIEFVDDQTRILTSRNAIRKSKCKK